MLHNRIASELRSHFSTVGPSPQANNHADSAATTSAPTIPTSGPRLVVLPSSGTAAPQSSPLLSQLRNIAVHRFASFFAEAAVLIFVFGLLDRLLSRGHLELPWIAGVLSASLTLLAASVLADLSRTPGTRQDL